MTKRFRTARFWDYANNAEFGLVKITLRDGETVHHSSGGETEEGWSRTSIRYAYEGGLVTRDICNDGRDCDGRLTRYQSDTCIYAKLATKPAYDHPSFLLPTWEDGESSQRDYSAEAMNY